jgi:hypothetical protein
VVDTLAICLLSKKGTSRLALQRTSSSKAPLGPKMTADLTVTAADSPQPPTEALDTHHKQVPADFDPQQQQQPELSESDVAALKNELADFVSHSEQPEQASLYYDAATMATLSAVSAVRPMLSPSCCRAVVDR